MKAIRFTLIIPTLLAVSILYGPIYQNAAIANDGPSGLETSNRVDFENDLIPVFTKFGCNAGACHGAAAGRGEFNLSLFGGNPQADYKAIVRQFAGRRVNLIHPEESLILLKPTAQTKHGGGQVLNENDEGARLLLNWIQQGATYETLRHLERVEISPQKQVISNLENPIQLQANAHFSDGTTEDVTRWTVFTPEDTSAVEINPATGVAKLNRTGRYIIIARYLTEVVPIEFIAPLNEVPIQNVHKSDETHTSSESTGTSIDGEILKLLSTLRLPVSPAANDATFLRRVTLDLTGRLPAPDAVTAFLADSETNKRETLVDALLGSDEFNEYWTLQLAKLLRIRSEGGNTQGAFAYHQWLAQQVREGTGYDQIARSVILATGDSHEVGPANFYRTVDTAGEQAEFMSELFMGARLRCANCHNHPLDKWTQDDYHGLAAIFAKIEANGQVIKVKPSGEVIHPATREKAVPRIPGDRFLSADVADGRTELVDWLTGTNNPYFAKAIVNRLWKAMMGRGLVEPVDDFRSTNPATHPELLTELADDFVAHGYDLRRTLKRIALSAAYARSANTLPQNAEPKTRLRYKHKKHEFLVLDDRFYSHALQKPLESEVLADAISDVLGVPDVYGNEPEGTRAVSLFDPNTESDALDILGRCGRETSCENSAGATDGLQRKLHLFNGDLLNARIGVPGSRLDRLVSIGKSPMEIVNEFYLAALSRHPTDTEQQFWVQHIDINASANAQRAILEDIIWSLLTCNEFVTNH